MEKEELQNKEDQNLKDENSELSTDKQTSEETEKKEEEEQLSPEDEIANLKDKVARTFAEMENQRRRFEKEKDEAFEYGGFSFARETLNLLDNLERSKQTLESDETIKDKDTLKKLIEHINIINKDMISIFKKNNIKPIKAINEKLDPKNSIIFNQSLVPAHSEGSWILGCIARMGWLNRMTQFKEKAGKDKEKASVGLYIYPILMASDIILYDATHVPVGDDQKQHLELCRDIAQKFNNEYKCPDFLRPPEPLIQKNFSRIMSLKDGTKKMSKSDIAEGSRINLTDTEDQIINKIKKAKTDNDTLPGNEEGLKNRPEAENLMGIYSSLSNQNITDTLNEFEGKNFSDLKNKLSEVIVTNLSPISKEIQKLLSDKNYIDQILEDGAAKAQDISSKKVKKIKEIVGF